jgi:hypothetical protein
MTTKYTITIIFAGILLLSLMSPAMALEPGKMRMNGIEMNDVTQRSNFGPSGEVVVRNDDDTYLVFSPKSNIFWIEVSGSPYPESRKRSEMALLNELEISRNEACFLNVNVTAPRVLHPDIGRINPSLSFCSGPAQLDFNEDKIVNGADLSECLEGIVSPTENMACDLNVSGTVDATDLSLGITYFGMTVPDADAEAPTGPYTLEPTGE